MTSTTRVLLLFAASIALSASQTDAGPPRDIAPTVSISLTPDSSAYNVDRTLWGDCPGPSFTAAIRNEGGDTITVAYPYFPLSPAYDTETGRSPELKRGKSEILVKITQPGGDRLVLRPIRCGGFERSGGDRAFLVVPPGQSREFMVGWFFLNERGCYDRDDRAAVAFCSKGTYRVRIVYRNSFPKMRCYDGSVIDVWTGELESPAVTVKVK